jgi:flagella basal body P-ring formation protein FlgA
MSMLLCCVRFARRLAPGRCALACLRRVACATLGGAVLICHAQGAEPPPAASGLGDAIEQQVRQLAMSGSRTGLAGVTRFEVSVGQLDPRLRLAPCEQVEPYLPNGTRLWGRSRIGLRCTRGASAWNVYLPITVKAYGPGLVATALLPAGTVLGAGDVAQAEVDLAEDHGKALAESGAVVGRTLALPLKPGQSVRAAHLKARQWFTAGERVEVQARGPGFNVSSTAEALSNGVEGQPARVRTEGGRILTGTPVGERQMELNL